MTHVAKAPAVLVDVRPVPSDSQGCLVDLGDGSDAFVRGSERGSHHVLHPMYPRGGPRKQGNRLAGLLRTRGKH